MLNEFIAALGMMNVTAQLLERAHAAAMRVINAMSEMEPFSHLDHAFYTPSIADAFTPEAIEQVRALNMAMLTRGLSAAQEPGLRKGALLSKIAPVLAQLAFSLAEYKRAMTALAEAKTRMMWSERRTASPLLSDLTSTRLATALCRWPTPPCSTPRQASRRSCFAG